MKKILVIAVITVLFFSTHVFSLYEFGYEIEGFGSNTIGGTGGVIFYVSDAASFGNCINASGARICEFTKGGLIEGNYTINNPHLTIKGQTAPSPVTIKGEIHIATSQVIIQYLTVRRGPGGSNHAISIYKNDVPLSNIVIDHCSLSWGTDSNIETWYQVHDLTVQWSIISEALDCSTHPKGCHSKGALWGGPRAGEGSNEPGSYNISFHHNIIAHSAERTPLIATAGIADVVENIIYNPHWQFSHVNMEEQIVPILANFVNNICIAGPDTDVTAMLIKTINPSPQGAEIYQSGNTIYRRDGTVLTGLDAIDSSAYPYLVDNRHFAPTTSSYSMRSILDGAGNNWNGWRDAIDRRIIADIENRTGHIIDDPSDVGGWIIETPVPLKETSMPTAILLSVRNSSSKSKWTLWDKSIFYYH